MYIYAGIKAKERTQSSEAHALGSPFPGVPVMAPFQGTASQICFLSFGWSAAKPAKINTCSSVSNRASTVYLMCQEMLSNDYKLHNSIPLLSSLSPNHGSLWCEYKLLQAFCILGTASSGTTQVLSLHFACSLKSVTMRGSGKSALRACHPLYPGISRNKP